MTIVGSGPSLHAILPQDVLVAAEFGAPVIAVNGAIDWLQQADFFFTLDGSEENMRRMRHPVHGCGYFAATPKETPAHVVRLQRVTGGKNDLQPEPEEQGTPEWWLWRWSAKLGLSEDPKKIHSGNSMYGALGLAYHAVSARPPGKRKIVLLGLDGTDEQRVTGGIPYNLSHLPLLFASAIPQLERAGIEVVNGNPSSTVDCFPRMRIEEALQWAA